jgi:hypothetical protein
MYPICGSFSTKLEAMREFLHDAFSADLGLQFLMIAFSLCFAGVMSWRYRGGATSFVTFGLQGMVLVTALVAIVSLFFPSIYESLMNQKATVALLSMMALIYATRDVFDEVTRTINRRRED